VLGTEKLEEAMLGECLGDAMSLPVSR
jgi:ADP-ribosylglycohydrolase